MLKVISTAEKQVIKISISVTSAGGTTNNEADTNDCFCWYYIAMMTPAALLLTKPFGIYQQQISGFKRARLVRLSFTAWKVTSSRSRCNYEAVGDTLSGCAALAHRAALGNGVTWLNIAV